MEHPAFFRPDALLFTQSTVPGHGKEQGTRLYILSICWKYPLAGTVFNKFGTAICIVNVLNSDRFLDNPLKGFYCTEDQHFPFPIGKWGRYWAVCDCELTLWEWRCSTPRAILSEKPRRHSRSSMDSDERRPSQSFSDSSHSSIIIIGPVTRTNKKGDKINS